jgi:hypothetical protein
MRINYDKHFLEDDKFEAKYEAPYKTLRYIRKLSMREEISKLRVDHFLAAPKYQDLQIWDIKYISTSDEEDNDSSENESSSSEEGSGNDSDKEEKKEEKPQSEKKGRD